MNMKQRHHANLLAKKLEEVLGENSNQLMPHALEKVLQATTIMDKLTAIHYLAKCLNPKGFEKWEQKEREHRAEMMRQLEEEEDV